MPIIDVTALTQELSTGPGAPIYVVPNASVKLLEALINAAWDEGMTAKAAYTTKIAGVQADIDALLANGTNNVTAGTAAVPTISEPVVTIPATADVGDIISTFDTKYLELVALLKDKMTEFRTNYFPTEDDAYLAAETWLKEAVANPAGLPPAVAAQIWGDDHARVVENKLRAQDAVVAQFAARRFPLLPDAAASAVLQIEQKAQDELAESSRKQAILAIELQKFSVEKLIDLRKTAMDSAVKYITALASGPEMASRLVGVGYDAQSKLISSVSQFYNARTGAAEVVTKASQFNASLAMDAATKNQAADLALIDDKVRSLMSEAQTIAAMATSLFNNLHAQVSMSAGGSVVGAVNQ